MFNQYKYEVILGQPEVERYFNNLKQRIESMTANEEETKFYFKIKKAIFYLRTGQHPLGFKSKHKEQIDSLTKKFTKLMNSDIELPVHHGHLELGGKAREIFWSYVPNSNRIVIIAISDFHPKNDKEYDRVKSSRFPSENKEKQDLPKISKGDLFQFIEGIGDLFYIKGLINKDNSIFGVISENSELFIFLKVERGKYIFVNITYEEYLLFKSNSLSLSDILLDNSNKLMLLTGDRFKSIDFDEINDYLPSGKEMFLHESMIFLKKLIMILE